ELKCRVDIGHALNHHDRAERFLAHQPRVCGRVRDDCGTENGPAALRLEYELGALGDGILDHFLHTVGGRAAHHWPHVDGGIVGIAHLELLRCGNQQLEEAVEHRSLHDHALRGDAL